jgi:hypothetical protein
MAVFDNGTKTGCGVFSSIAEIAASIIGGVPAEIIRM